MSWFYEALLRAEKERPKTNNGEAPKKHSLNGESLLAPVEPLTHGRTGAVEAKHAPVFDKAISTVNRDATAPSIRQPDRCVDVSSNGFRHLFLPGGEDSRFVFRADPHGLPAEQFRLLRRKLKQGFANGAVLLITSPGEGDGKTLTSMNLAACLASSGDKTLLVEGDLRRPGIGRFSKERIESPGIEDAWAGKAEAREAVQLFEEISLYAALVAEIPANPAQLVNGSGAREFIRWARENFRWVVVDAPPVFPTADVVELLPLTDAALLVIRAQNTPKELSTRAFEMLGTHLHGVVFNAATINSNPYYGYFSPNYQGVNLPKGSEASSLTK
jgi:capsular exopolysaccharide synthesis family protein